MAAFQAVTTGTAPSTFSSLPCLVPIGELMGVEQPQVPFAGHFLPHRFGRQHDAARAGHVLFLQVRWWTRGD